MEPQKRVENKEGWPFPGRRVRLQQLHTGRGAGRAGGAVPQGHLHFTHMRLAQHQHAQAALANAAANGKGQFAL